jgi:hypothetical protein
VGKVLSAQADMLTPSRVGTACALKNTDAAKLEEIFQY